MLRLGKDPPHFDVLVVGCAGGPSEDDLSCYFLKPKSKQWKDGFLSIEGGSGMGALSRMLSSHPDAFRDFDLKTPPEILELCTAYLISHAHFDHISGLVLSAGSCKSPKHIYGMSRTISNLENVFDGGVWPALASRAENSSYIYKLIPDDLSAVECIPGILCRSYPVSHGTSTKGDAYDSTAFVIEEPSDGQSFLFFGDVGADSISPQPRNRAVWQEAARLIALRKLSTIFIECSYTSSRDKSQLYGHLSPPYLFEELRTLASFLSAPSPSGRRQTRRTQAPPSTKGSLAGVTICIMHIKDGSPVSTEPPRITIQRELEALEAAEGLGVRFVMLEQGMRLEL